MSTESLKRVLMATKEKARGMRKEKLLGRMNPKAPEETKEPVELGAEPMEESPAPELPIGEGMEPEGIEPPVEGPPSEEEKAAAVEEIRALLARV